LPAAVWSTDEIKPRERIAFWREAVCQTVLNVTPEEPGEDFHASISGRSFGALRFASFSSTAHSIIREQRHVDCAGEDQYLIGYQRSGRSELAQAGRELWLDPGEITIVDGTQPFRTRFPQPVRRILALVPRYTLDLRAPWIRRNGICKVPVASAFSMLARGHIRQLAGEEPLKTEQAQLLADNLCNLLAAATAPELTGEKIQTDIQLQAIIAYCREHLGDPELSPRRVAEHFRISVRTLHLRFEGAQYSFARWLLDSRLEECRRVLCETASRSLSITEIAFRCGFNDLSHFSKSYKAKFDETPRGTRALAFAGSA
jgi:AraC-like DNA-binding protein